MGEFGVFLQKTIKLAHDVKASEANRRGDAQFAAQCGACATRCQDGLFSLLDRAFCPDIKIHPRFGRGKAACRSQQKTNTKPFLKLSNRLGYRWLSDSHLARRGGERSRVDDANESLHRKVPVHIHSPLE